MKSVIVLLLFCLSCTAQEVIKTPKPDFSLGIWPDRPLLEKSDDEVSYKRIVRITKVKRPAIEFFKAKNISGEAPCVVIFPGGGYGILAYDLEGTDIATWLNSIGFHAVILKYTVPGNRRAEALQDAQRAVGIVRSKAKEWGVKADKIGVLGFSAGGHLVANVSTNYQERAYKAVDEADKVSCRPDFSVLVYPAYIYEKKDKTKIAPEIKVNKNTPPAFIVQALDDRNYVDSALNYCRAMKNAKVDCDLHIYAKGGHGYGMRPSANEVSKWTEVCGKWLKQIAK
jgi:acetyl esterase/lipase